MKFMQYINVCIQRFLHLKDTPSSYSGQGGKFVAVKSTADGLEFVDAPTGEGGTMQVTGLTLLSTGWTLVSGLYEYALTNVNITANSIVDVIPANADVDIVKAAEILPETNSSSGSVKVYSVNAPTANISVTINITEKA